MKRREFVTLLGGAAVLPLAAHAQQPVLPVIGFVSGRSEESSVRFGGAFRKALNETGYVEGQNVMVEYHWLDGQYERLPSLMSDLVSRQVAVSYSRLRRWCPRGQSCHRDDSDRLRPRARPGQAWSGRQPCPAGRQRDRHQSFDS